jgi:glycosyltransferase involved in cell wall biosynthesis
MRIGVLHQYSLESSGSGLYGVHVIEHLLRRGHQVVVVSRDPHPERLGFVDEVWHHDETGVRRTSLSSEPPRCVAHSLLGGVHGIAYPRADDPDGVIFAGMTQLQREGYLRYQSDEITSIVRRHGIEVMHANHEVPMAEIARRVEMRTGVPYVVVAHGSTIEYVYQADTAWHSATRDGLRGARRLIALNAEGRDRLLAVDPGLADSIAVSAVGVDTKVFRPERRVRERRTATTAMTSHEVVAFVGRVSWEKGLHVLLAAMPSLVARRPDVRLVVIGDGENWSAMEELATHLGAGDRDAALAVLDVAAAEGAAHWVEPVRRYLAQVDPSVWTPMCRAANLAERITFTGHLNQSGVAERLARADVLVVPSLVKEAFPLVVLEALSCGVPPLGTLRGGLSSVLDELSPRLGPVGERMRLGGRRGASVATVSRGVSLALETLAAPGARADARRRCRRLATSSYDWAGVAARLESAYREAAADAVKARSLVGVS